MSQEEDREYLAIGGHQDKINYSEGSKAIIEKMTHKTEFDFYARVNDSDAEPQLKKFAKFIPAFHGGQLVVTKPNEP